MKKRPCMKSRPGWPALWLVLIISIFFAAAGARPAAAQSGITILSDNASLDFPNNLTFSLKAEGTDRITEVYLDYGTNAVTCVRASGRIPVDVDPGREVMAVWEWDFKDSGSLPAGAEVWWRWEIHTEDGSRTQTEQQTLVVEDGRFDWDTTGELPLLYYHDTTPSFAVTLQRTGLAALEKMKDEFGIEPSRLVKIVLYNDASELREAALFLPEWVGGLAHPEYSILYISVGDGDTEWGTEVIYHEIAHLISGELTTNCLGVTMPTWLSEGFSVYMEDGPSASERQDVIDALESGELPTLRTLTSGFSSNSFEATRSYAQSGMVVRYLIDTYGGEKIPILFAAIQDGQLINDALINVFGVNADGLDAAWRTSLGFAAEATPTPTPAADGLPTAIPTLPLFDPDIPTAVAAQASPTTAPEEPAPTETAVPTLAPTAAAPAAGRGLPCLSGNALVAGLMAAVLIPVRRARRK